MKKIIFLALLVSLFSCTNPALDIKTKVTVTVRPSTVLSAFTFYNSSNMEMYSDDNGTSELRLTALLYDSSGYLVENKEVAVKDYTMNCDFSFALVSDEVYKLICFSSCIQGPLAKPDYQAYEIDGISDLSTLKVTQVNEKSYYSTLSILGGGLADIKSGDSNITINLEPITSLVYARWVDIHAHDGENESAASIYGVYKASADNYWKTKTYNWDITVEKDGSSTTNVIVKNLDPYLVDYGFTADKGYNIFKGVIEGSSIRIAGGQKTGFQDSDKHDLVLEGISKVEGETLYFGDLFLTVSNGKLVTQNMYGILVVEDDEGWYSLYDSGIIFTQEGFSGIDMYGFVYHNNDFLTYSYDGFKYGTSLAGTANNGVWVEPARNPGKNIYDMINLLPGTYKLFGRTITGNERNDYSRRDVTIERGQQYVMAFDCKNYTVGFSRGLDAMTKSQVDFGQAFRFSDVSLFRNFHPVEKRVRIPYSL